VVRDRATGNIGIADIALPSPEQAPQTDPDAEARARQATLAAMPYGNTNLPPQGPIGSFGSVVPSSHSFCGDVYELSGEPQVLPDFREGDPVEAIYATALDVPDQIFSGTAGIPGVTNRTVGFGIDYHGAFWIETPGQYSFRMMSDDGAILEIDNQDVIDLNGLHEAQTRSAQINLVAGAHTIHVPYFQGRPNAVALELWIKPPKGRWRVFDLTDYQPPATGLIPK
jgi:hypothetical protein